MATQNLFLLSPDTVLAARVNGTVTYPLGSVPYDGAVGDFNDVRVGMTVLFGSTAGADDKGRQRIRLAAGAATLYIGRSSQGTRDGEVDLDDNDYISVIDDRRVWAKIPAMDVSDTSNPIIYKDHDLAFTDQTDEIPPKANIAGGAAAGTINSGTSLLTVTFVGTASYAAADGASISSYDWDVGGGTITAGTGTNTITATFPAGFHYVRLTVTDSNGKTHFMDVPVYAHDPDDSLCVAFQCTEHTITQSGQVCSFRILEDIPATTYPDGTLVIMWEGEPASASDRSNVKFWGWHQTDGNTVTAEPTATLRDVTLTCVDVAGRLDTLPGFPQSVENKGTPDTWLSMKTLNMDKYIDYLFRWHSNAFEVAYYTPSGTGSAFPMVIIGSDGESLFDQCQRRARALVPDYVLTCNRNGEMKVLADPILQETADRTATSQGTIDANDWTAVNWQHTRPPRIHWLWGEALVASSSTITAVFCTAPGMAPGQGESENPSGEQLTQSQDDLNKAEGHRYARLNAVNGQVSVQMPVDIGIDPADMTWVVLDVDGDYAARRALGFSSARGLPVEVNISYEYAMTGLVKTVEMIWEQETTGSPAVTYTPPTTDWPWEPPPPVELPTPDDTEGDGFGTNYFQVDDYLARTRDLSAASPSWSDITGAITGTLYDFILSPQSPSTTAYAASSTGFWKSTTMANASPTWVQIRTTAEINTGYGSSAMFGTYKISASINVPGFVAFWHGVTVSTEYMACTITTDGGSTWSYNRLWTGAGPTLDTGSFLGAADYLPHLVGGEVVLGAVFERQSGKIYFYQSTDSGATWSGAELFDNGSASTNQCLTLHYPYNNNPTGQIIWFVLAGGGGAALHGLYRSTNSGTTWTRLNTGETGAKRHGAESYTSDRQRLFHWRENNTLWLSTDGGGNWTQAAAAGITGTVRAAGGFPFNNQQYYVLTTTGYFVSVNNGALFIDKTGDWANGFTCTVGGGAIGVDWTE